MNVSCTQCQTVFRVDPAKVPVDGVRARCSVCSGVFWVRREAEAPAAVPAAVPAAAPVRAAPPAPVAAPAPPPPPGPAPAPLAAPAPPPAPPLSPPAFARPAVVPPAAPAAPAPSYRPTTPPAPAFAPPPSRPAAPQAPAATAPGVVRPKRPTNPFLSQDPEARARRLARALVSDIVVYHPAKRRDGLRDGSLKLLFEEEIRKSWDEYVDQVGKQLADSTTFFNDALNEILADGQPVFP